MPTLSTSEARDNLAEILNRVAYGGERVVLHRRGKALAVLVSVEDLSRLEAIENASDLSRGLPARAQAAR
ncbi:MAG: type II toxin-antitoxin system Phd/YefM family antitoxin [Armatimonadetes bacterium]|nr:type II toxin-antitoxin system Phd/YefM family antitoxin [Armatimonadota bacterium]